MIFYKYLVKHIFYLVQITFKTSQSQSRWADLLPMPGSWCSCLVSLITVNNYQCSAAPSLSCLSLIFSKFVESKNCSVTTTTTWWWCLESVESWWWRVNSCQLIMSQHCWVVWSLYPIIHTLFSSAELYQGTRDNFSLSPVLLLPSKSNHKLQRINVRSQCLGFKRSQPNWSRKMLSVCGFKRGEKKDLGINISTISGISVCLYLEEFYEFVFVKLKSLN